MKSDLDQLRETYKKRQQPRKAYGVDIDLNRVGKQVLVLIEYELLSLYFLNNAPSFVTGKGQIIWDSDESSVIPRPRFAGGASGIATRCNMFLDLSEAHNYLQSLLNDRLLSHWQQLHDIKQKIQNLEQIEIKNLPKETYVSPITGKQT